MDRTCKTCGKVKPLEEFAKAGIINGKLYRRYLCIPCYTKSKKPRKQKIKQWWLDYRKTLRCSRCGNDDFRVLDFHHHCHKDFNLGDGIRRGLSKDKILAEVLKCEVMCSNCHRILHYEETNGLECV